MSTVVDSLAVASEVMGAVPADSPVNLHCSKYGVVLTVDSALSIEVKERLGLLRAFAVHLRKLPDTDRIYDSADYWAVRSLTLHVKGVLVNVRVGITEEEAVSLGMDDDLDFQVRRALEVISGDKELGG